MQNNLIVINFAIKLKKILFRSWFYGLKDVNEPIPEKAFKPVWTNLKFIHPQKHTSSESINHQRN